MSLYEALLLDPAPFHVWVANRTDMQRGAGTCADPYHGGLNRFGVSQFDAIMNLAAIAQNNVVVHLGPGTFITQGFIDGTVRGWQLRTGMKILGSGIDVTLLQIDNTAVPAGTHVFAIAHPLQSATTVDAAEVCDLTINANCGGTNAAAFGGIRLLGNNSRIRRIKIKNWGTLSSSVPAFGLVCLTGNPASGVYGVDNTGIEDCYAVEPAAGATNTIATAFSIGDWTYTAVPAPGREAEGKSPFIRNCYIDGRKAPVVDNPFTPSPLVPPGAVAANRSLSTLVGISMCWCRGGVAEGNQIYNVDVAGPYQISKSIRDGIVRNNFAKNVARCVFLNLGQLASKLNTTGAANVSVIGNVATLSGGGFSLAASGLSAGDRVSLDTGMPGDFLVLSVDTTAQNFTVATTAFPGNYTVSNVNKVLNVSRVIIEGNTVELAPGNIAGIAFQVLDNQTTARPPDNVNGDLILKGNKVRYVDGAFDVSYLGFATDLYGANNIQVQSNAVQCAPVNPLRNSRSGRATYFNNLTPAGVLVQGFKSDPPTKKYSELQTDADDAFVLAFAERG